MIDVVVAGATGKLGRMVCGKIASSSDMKLVGAVVSPSGGHIGTDVFGATAVGPDGIAHAAKACDVYVDLTTPSAASATIADIPDYGANLVLGTTSVDPAALSAMASAVERNGTSALVSANFAKGVNIFWKVCEEMSGYLSDYDIEIVEAHHSSKRDAPSGTTKEMVRRIREQTGIDKVIYGREGDTGPRQREICVHSIRAGDIVGDHTVIFAKNMERVELTHKAISREALADGCVESIRWISERRDGRVHSMNEVFGL